MELKVWVEGIQRIVCGVNDATTCQDVVYALAHATGKTGRFTLVERWRHNERLLPPHERPLCVLAKWGEYAGDVQLLLRRSNSPPSGPALDPAKPVRPPLSSGESGTRGFILEPAIKGPRSNAGFPPPSSVQGSNNPHHSRDPMVRKSLTFSGSGGGGGGGTNAPPNYQDPPPFSDSPKGRRDWSGLPCGVVKGFPQQSLKENTGTAVEVGGGSNKERCGLGGGQDGNPPGPNKSSCLTRLNEKTGPLQPNPPQYQPPPTIHWTEQQSSRIQAQAPPPELRDSCEGGISGQTGANTSGTYPNGSDTDPGVTRVPPTATTVVRAAPASQDTFACAISTSGSTDDSPSFSAPRSITTSAPMGPGRPQSQSQVGSPPPQQMLGAIRGPAIPVANRLPSPSNRGSAAEHQQHHRGPTSPPRIPVPIHMGTPKSRRNLLSEFRRHDLEEELREDSFLSRGHQDRVVYDARYKDLVRLVNLQREKLGRQQADLTQCDAEIAYWEEKQKDHQRQIEIIEHEIQKAEFSGRDADEEVVQLNKLHLDDELGIGRQQEKMLQSELTLLRSKLANCETELLQCKNKIRLLMDEITESKRFLSKEEEERKQREMGMLNEMEDLQRDIQERIKQYDSTIDSVDKLDSDVRHLESAIMEKKKQIECLVHEMKEANLASLTFTPSEEIRLLLEGGAHKGPGSSRKIVGSPRQLENAVPTSKNPHGVWV